MKDIEYLKKYYDGNIDDAIKELEKGRPVQYIVGSVDFCGNIINVNENVLIPRFETEELVYKTKDYIKKYLNDNISIIDIGTGSGCIPITLKKIFKNAKVEAVDISKEALEVAKDNGKGLDIDFYESNLLDNIKGKYDCLISNPPYISYEEDIMEIVKNNEPHLALYAENDGLYCYIRMLKDIKKYLNDKSIIAFEIGETQGFKISKYIDKYLPDSKYKIEKDMQGRDRFIFIFNNIELTK